MKIIIELDLNDAAVAGRSLQILGTKMRDEHPTYETASAQVTRVGDQLMESAVIAGFDPATFAGVPNPPTRSP